MPGCWPPKVRRTASDARLDGAEAALEAQREKLAVAQQRSADIAQRRAISPSDERMLSSSLWFAIEKLCLSEST